MNEERNQFELFGKTPIDRTKVIPKVTEGMRRRNASEPIVIKPLDPNRLEGQSFTGLAPEEDEGRPYKRPGEGQEAA